MSDIILMVRLVLIHSFFCLEKSRARRGRRREAVVSLSFKSAVIVVVGLMTHPPDISLFSISCECIKRIKSSLAYRYEPLV
jgi:preprotein translocase subunit YajC